MKKTVKILALVLSAILIMLAFTACLDMPSNHEKPGGTGQLPPAGDSGNGGSGSGGGNTGNGDGENGGGNGDDSGSQEEELPEGAIVNGDYVLLEIYSFKKQYKIYKYTGSDEHITVPSDFDGIAVSEIAEKAFASATNVKSISLPFIGTVLTNNTAPLVSVFGDALPTTLEEVEIRAGSRIIDGSLTGCENITTLTLGTNVSVDKTAELKKLSSLKKIYLSEHALSGDQMYIFKVAQNFPNLEFTESDGGYYIGTKENPYIFLMGVVGNDSGHLTVKTETKVITNNVLGEDWIKSVYIPAEVNYIGSFNSENLVFYIGPTETEYNKKAIGIAGRSAPARPLYITEYPVQAV